MPYKPFFTRELFQFLAELRFNNERAWFRANKSRYEEHLQRPMRAFLAALEEPLRRINPSILPGRMFRPYRDTRFSRDKTPYKCHLAAQFRHREHSGDAHGPGFYLHLEPGECHAAAGIWMPNAESLRRIRRRIAAKPAEWAPFSRWPLWGESLQRPPRGFDPAHPFIADIRRKHFITWVDFKDSEVCALDFLRKVAAAFKKMDPLVRFLSSALGLKSSVTRRSLTNIQ